MPLAGMFAGPKVDPLPDIRGQLAYPDERGLVDAAGRLLAESA